MQLSLKGGAVLKRLGTPVVNAFGDVQIEALISVNYPDNQVLVITKKETSILGQKDK